MLEALFKQTPLVFITEQVNVFIVFSGLHCLTDTALRGSEILS